MIITPLYPIDLDLRVQPGRPSLPSPEHLPTCSAPGCPERAAHRHHAVARSKLGGPFDFILIGDKLVVNVIDLCAKHHDMLESKPGGCEARLRWLRNNGWGWYIRADGRTDRASIWWPDPKTQTLWEFRGFMTGRMSWTVTT